MEDLSTKGAYTVTDSMKAFMKDFVGGYATEAENAAGIRHLADETGYIIDTHTGVASCVYKKYVTDKEKQHEKMDNKIQTLEV